MNIDDRSVPSNETRNHSVAHDPDTAERLRMLAGHDEPFDPFAEDLATAVAIRDGERLDVQHDVPGARERRAIWTRRAREAHTRVKRARRSEARASWSVVRSRPARARTPRRSRSVRRAPSRTTGGGDGPEPPPRARRSPVALGGVQ